LDVLLVVDTVFIAPCLFYCYVFLTIRASAVVVSSKLCAHSSLAALCLYERWPSGQNCSVLKNGMAGTFTLTLLEITE
jgi:hypothetical protein